MITTSAALEERIKNIKEENGFGLAPGELFNYNGSEYIVVDDESIRDKDLLIRLKKGRVRFFTRFVKDMSYLFAYDKTFNTDIGDWDLFNTKTTKGMFLDCKSFNKPVGHWNTRKVTNMAFMFSGALMFNQRLNTLDVSNVENMTAMFYGASSFNQPINKWDVSNVREARNMFYGASSFNKNIKRWAMKNVVKTHHDDMFSNCPILNEYKPTCLQKKVKK